MTQAAKHPGQQIVMASAGSGKTYALTTRMLALLAAGEPPRSLLAATFTRKAAGEILGRVLERLAEAAIDPEACAQLDDAVRSITGARIDPQRAAAMLGELVENAETLAVQTIDAFFQRVAVTHQLELSMPPGWSIGTEEAASVMRSEAVDRALLAFDSPRLADVLRLMWRGAFGSSVAASVERRVGEAHGAFVQTASVPEVWSCAEPQGSAMSAEDASKLAERVAELEVPRTKAGGERSAWRKMRERLAPDIAARRWRSIGATNLVQRADDDEPKFDGAPIEGEWLEIAQVLAESAQQAVRAELHGQNVATRELLGAVDAQLRELKAERGTLRFDDVPRLLGELGFEGGLDHLYYRLDARYRHVLLDEFQDTSVAQLSLLEPILDELLQSQDGGSVFVVGDIKQSLYGWRNAEPELMPYLASSRENLDVLSLATNRRSSPVVISAVNEVLDDVAASDTLQGTAAAIGWDKNWSEHVAHHQKLTGAVRLIEAPEGARDERNKVSAADQKHQADLVAAERIEAILQEHPGFTVGVLVRRNSRARDLVELLRARGIDASDEGGGPLIDEPAVRAACSALGLIDHPGDTARLFHVATSPLGEVFGVSFRVGEKLDQEAARRAASKWRRVLLEDGYAALLSRWLNGCARAMDEGSFGRFTQLVDLAAEFDASSDEGARLRPTRFVSWCEQRKIDRPVSAPVQVMTIHRSKGLEFDAVVLPELDDAWKVDDDVVVRSPEPMAEPDAATFLPSKAERGLDAFLSEVFAYQEKKRWNEWLCTLYVAMTRAERVLEMIVHPPKKDPSTPSAARLLRERLAYGESGTEFGRGMLLHETNTIEASEATPLGPDAEPVCGTIDVRFASKPASLRRAAQATPSGLAASGAFKMHFGSGASGAERGNAVHACFECVGWLEDGVPERGELVSAASQAAQSLSDAASSSIADEILGVLETEAIAGALRRERYTVPQGGSLDLRREQRIIAPLEVGGKQTLLRGQIDRLVLVRDAEGRVVEAEVLDFKSDRARPGEDSAELVQRLGEAYREQMDAYRRALSARLGLEKVSVALVVIEAAAVLELPV